MRPRPGRNPSLTSRKPRPSRTDSSRPPRPDQKVLLTPRIPCPRRRTKPRQASRVHITNAARCQKSAHKPRANETKVGAARGGGIHLGSTRAAGTRGTLPIDHETATPTTDLQFAIFEVDTAIEAIDLLGGVEADLLREAMIRTNGGIRSAFAMTGIEGTTVTEIAVETAIGTGSGGTEKETGIGIEIGTDIAMITIGAAATMRALALALDIGHAHAPAPLNAIANGPERGNATEIETPGTRGIGRETEIGRAHV